jgi:hypothetical protein
MTYSSGRRREIPGYTSWVRVGDLTDKMIRDIENAQRADAGRRGELAEWDKEYRARMRGLRRDERIHGSN